MNQAEIAVNFLNVIETSEETTELTDWAKCFNKGKMDLEGKICGYVNLVFEDRSVLFIIEGFAPLPLDLNSAEDWACASALMLLDLDLSESQKQGLRDDLSEAGFVVTHVVR